MSTCDLLVKLYLEYIYASENGRSRAVSCVPFYLFSSSCCVTVVLLSVFSILSCPVNCSALVSDVSGCSFFLNALWTFSGRLFIICCSKTIFGSFHIFWQSDCICQNIYIASELSASSSKQKLWFFKLFLEKVRTWYAEYEGGKVLKGKVKTGDKGNFWCCS